MNVPTFGQGEDGSFVASPIQEQIHDDAEMIRSADMVRRPSDVLRTLAGFENQEPLDMQDEIEDYWEDGEEDGERFINYFLLSHIAVQLRDKIPRGTHVKGSIPYQRAFTGKDIVVSIDHAFKIFNIMMICSLHSLLSKL